MSTARAELSSADRSLVLRALKHPRGRYSAERAGQLSSIPSRTLHDWATSGALVPDWVSARPRGWSYRDILYARLLAWLRAKHMTRAKACERVAHLRSLLTISDIDPSVYSDGTIFLIGDDETDHFTGQQVFDGLSELLDVFVLTEAIEGVSNQDLWGPSLIYPSRHTFISPWVVGGEPCVVDSRVPTATLHALHVDRGLDPEAIHRLYSFLSVDAVDDALVLETRLRAA